MPVPYPRARLSRYCVVTSLVSALKQHAQDLIIETIDWLILKCKWCIQSYRDIGKSCLYRDTDLIVCCLDQCLGYVLVWGGIRIVCECFLPTKSKSGCAD